MSKSIKHLASILTSAALVLAIRDWPEACTEGLCSFDVPHSMDSIGAKIVLVSNSIRRRSRFSRLWISIQYGPHTAISDITPAAGWEILAFSSGRLPHDVRLVCTGRESDCGHLFEGSAENTIVRLPENVSSRAIILAKQLTIWTAIAKYGAGPFARISKVEVSQDQSLPPHLFSRLRRRDGKMPEVHSVTLDTNFTL